MCAANMRYSRDIDLIKSLKGVIDKLVESRFPDHVLAEDAIGQNPGSGREKCT